MMGTKLATMLRTAGLALALLFGLVVAESTAAQEPAPGAMAAPAALAAAQDADTEDEDDGDGTGRWGLLGLAGLAGLLNLLRRDRTETRAVDDYGTRR